jgi:hypothetical protein
MAEVELREARAERRAQALEQRLHACEGELGARRMAELQAARRAMVVRVPEGGGGEVSGTLTLGSAGGSQGEAKGAGALQAKGEGAFDADESGRGPSGVGPTRWQISLAERCALAEEMVEARNAELEATRVELAAATEERRLIGEGAASGGRYGRVQVLCAQTGASLQVVTLPGQSRVSGLWTDGRHVLAVDHDCRAIRMMTTVWPARGSTTAAPPVPAVAAATVEHTIVGIGATSTGLEPRLEASAVLRQLGDETGDETPTRGQQQQRAATGLQ